MVRSRESSSSIRRLAVRSIIRFALATIVLCSVLGCGDDPADPTGSGGGDCELVTQGESYLKIVNDSGGEIDVFFNGFAFESLIRSDVCEIYGMPSGNRSVDVTKRPYGPTRRVGFALTIGETYLLTVTSGFWD